MHVSVELCRRAKCAVIPLSTWTNAITQAARRTVAARAVEWKDCKEQDDDIMTLSLAPIVALIAGILILIIPRLLNYIVALYLIIVGLLGLFGGGSLRL
jgi:hypothetical protein